jgi:two-component system OmpR family response regulator
MRVLVVEDEIRLAALLKRGLERDGYAVDVCHEGDDGLWMALDNDYDAIVLDVMLPGLSGLELCRRLRAEEAWVPVLMLTARDGIDSRIAGLDAGADDYLIKPFNFGELRARIRALVRRGATSRPPILRVGDLTLDPATRVAARGGQQVDLTAKATAVLEMLMRHPGEVLSRAQILDHVWDFAHAPDSNIVDQHVALLRRKLDRPFGRSDIETVRGAGYRLRAEPR